MPPQPNPIVSLIPIAVIFLIFYVLLIRPQQKQQREHDEMLKNLKSGDKILTSGGLYGTIVGLRGESDLEVKFSESVKLWVARSAVTRLVGEAAAKPAGKPVS
jgi:preprotein translocase subunit YajC